MRSNPVSCTVLDIALKDRYLFLLSELAGHLWHLILEVQGFLALLGHINMEMLKHFCVVVICDTKILGGLHIMDYRVKLWFIYVISDSEVNQNMLVFVK